MNLTEIQDRLLGSWVGKNLLRLSWLNPTDYYSESNLSVAPAARGRFLTFTYTWSHENIAQEGLLLIGYDQKQAKVTGAWVDSWHQSSKVLHLEGSIDDTGVITVQGAYEAPPGPDWGWRITLTPGAVGNLQLSMHNISPEGEEDLAVLADYQRTV
jgi:hypothetical protein